MDEQLAELKELAGAKVGAVFRLLPVSVAAGDAASKDSLVRGFERMFHCDEAKQERDVVFCWMLAQPYSDGALTSRIVNIEETSLTISERWMNEIHWLAKDVGQPGAEDLRALASNRSWSFYSKAINLHGPLSVWWASTASLNAASGLARANAREWEKELIARFRELHDCWPLKNFKA